MGHETASLQSVVTANPTSSSPAPRRRTYGFCGRLPIATLDTRESETRLGSTGHILKSTKNGKERPTRSSTIALVCAWLCVVAYLWPALHALGRTYEGIESFILSVLILVPALPLGTGCGIIGITLSDSGSATSRRAGWALALMWLVPVILVIVMFVVASLAA